MDIKKFIIGGVIGGLVFFFSGWLMYGVLLADFMRHNPGELGLIGRKEALFPYLIAGQLLYGFLLAFMLLKSNVNSIGGGLVTGAIVGGMLSAAVNLTTYGTSIMMSKKGMAADIIAVTIMAALAGATIAAVVGRRKIG